MTPDAFKALLQPLTKAVAGQPVEPALADTLDRLFPADGETFRAVEAACHKAIAAGWMCDQGDVGRRFGRVVEPSPETDGLSIDVVDLIDVAGPHHRHPKGEICMVMPVTPTARFCGNGRGWCVYGPGSAHRPTVTDGEAVVLYLLPDGEIEFTV